MMPDGDLSSPIVIMSSLHLRPLWDGEFDFEYQSEALVDEFERIG